MKTISIREFQRNTNKYINDLPIELTRYGSIVAIVSDSENGASVKQQLKDHEERIQSLEESVNRSY